MKGKMNAAIGISIGSAAQLLCFILPLSVLFAWIGGVGLSIQYPAIEAEAFLIGVVIIAAATNMGRSTWLTGACLLVAYLLIALGLYTGAWHCPAASSSMPVLPKRFRFERP